MAQMAVGAYQTACESSPYKLQIDEFINEGKSSIWISKELKMRYNENISDKSITKYRKYREEFLQKELEKSPLYQGKMNMLNQQLVDGIGQIRQVDAIGKLADTIDNCATLINDAMDDEDRIKIKNAQDFRFISQTMLEAIKIYGDTVLKAQRFNAVEQDPSLLRPTTVNVNIKQALVGVLKDAMSNGSDGYGLIDKLRNSIGGEDSE